LVTMIQTVYIPFSKPMAVLVNLFWVVSLCLFAPTFTHASRIPERSLVPAAVFVALVLGSMIWFGIGRLLIPALQGKPALVLSLEGIGYPVLGIAVAWANVSSVDLRYNGKGGIQIKVLLMDNKDVKGGYDNLLKTCMSKLRTLTRGTPMVISPTFLEGNNKEIYATIEKYLEDVRAAARRRV
jgi:hypothetical protein